MIAIDTNILVYAHRREMPQHESALRWLSHLAEGTAPWGIPVFCLGEFLRVVTHPRILKPPSSLEEGLGAISALLASPGLRVISPGHRYSDILAEEVLAANARGNLVFDAQIAAVCREEGVDYLLTSDRDFSLFPQVRTLSTSSPLSSDS